MSVEASRARAREAAAKLPHVPGDVSELLRADAVALCTRLPEPPAYRRRDDPARAAAEAAIPECEALLARAFQANDAAWTAALDAWLTTLHHIAAGKVELAEASWVDAQRLEQLASGRRQALRGERRGSRRGSSMRSPGRAASTHGPRSR
jgi:hypothetical protein